MVVFPAWDILWDFGSDYIEKLTSYKQAEKCQQVKSIALVNLAQY